MRTIFSLPTAASPIFTLSIIVRLLTVLERWWIAYMTWRFEQLAIAQLWSLSDPTLKDIGLTRTEITIAVRGEVTRDR
jgi:uncharacterized protein YjiS (DUF1127 family)